MANYNKGKYKISIAGDEKIQNKSVAITDAEGKSVIGASINGVPLGDDTKFQDIVDGLAYGGIVYSNTALTPDTSCYYITAGIGTYNAFGGVVVGGSEKTQILYYDTANETWDVDELPWYKYSALHGKMERLTDIDELIPSDADPDTNPLATENFVHDAKAFKGWFDSSSDLSTAYPTPVVGDFAYVHDASPATVSIYRCATAGTWADSGDDVDTSLVQTFASGEEVNEVHIVNDLTTGGTEDVLSAAQGVVLDGKVSQLEAEVNGLAPLTEYVGRLESTSAKIANVSTYRYMVVPVSPGDSVKLTSGTGGCFYYIVSTFTFNPTLPYDLVLATGETSRHNTTEGNTTTVTMPSDAAYIILRGTIVILSINGRDVLKSLPGIIQETNGRVDELTERVDYVDIGVSQKFDGITRNQFVGDLTSAKTIVTGATKKYVVISVNGGQVFKYKRTNNPSTIFYVVKEFSLNPALPYNLVLATGETTYYTLNTANYEYSLTLANDAKYIIMLSENNGTNYIPESLTLDDVNILNSYDENLGLSEEIDALVLREAEGYYRATSPYRFSAIAGWYATELIPVYPGDKIVSNTTYNAPYNTVGHLCFDKDGNYVQVLNMTDGKAEITQAMFDAGVRFIGVSYDKTETPSPTLMITRDTLNVLESQINDVEDEIDSSNTRISTIENKCRIVITKTESAGFIVEVYDKNGKKVKYHFTRYLKVWDELTYLDGDGQTQTITDFTSADMWGNDAIYDNGDNYIIQGNTNFICQVYGDTRHIGDQHGNEVLKVCKFFADGVEFSPLDLTGPLTCHELRWMWKSEVYSPNLSGQNVYTGAYPRFDTDGNPIVNYTHYMEGTLNDANEMRLDNRLCIKQNGLKFNAAFGAMLECYYGDFSLVSVATNESTINSVANDGTATAVFSDIILSSNPNQLANKAVMTGDDFLVEQSIEVKEGTPNVHCEFYSNRLKIYFMPVKGDTYKAEAWQPDEFNEGDRIRVLTYRKIDIDTQS